MDQPGVFKPTNFNRAERTRTGKDSNTVLVLSRKIEESIVIGDNIEIKIVEIRGDKVRLGITAPREVPVHRQEVFDAIQEEAE